MHRRSAYATGASITTDTIAAYNAHAGSTATAASTTATSTADTVYELEVRFQNTDVKTFSDIYQGALGSFDLIGVENSINVISHDVYERADSASYIRKITFDGPVRTSDDYYIKQRL